jgi:hypothetical protein
VSGEFQKLWNRIEYAPRKSKQKWRRLLNDRNRKLFSAFEKVEDYCRFIETGYGNLSNPIVIRKEFSREIVGKCRELLTLVDSNTSTLSDLRTKKENVSDELDEKQEAKEKLSSKMIRLCARIDGKLSQMKYEIYGGPCFSNFRSKAVLFSNISRIKSNEVHKINAVRQGKTTVKLRSGATSHWPKYVEMAGTYGESKLEEEIADLLFELKLVVATLKLCNRAKS